MKKLNMLDSGFDTIANQTEDLYDPDASIEMFDLDSQGLADDVVGVYEG